MPAHDAAALLEGQGVPLPLLHHRVDEEVRRAHRAGRHLVLLALVAVAAEVLRGPGHRQVRVGGAQSTPELRGVDAGLQVLDRPGALRDLPQADVGVRPEADRRVGIHLHRERAFEEVRQLLLLEAPLLGRQRPPGRVHLVQHVAHEPAGFGGLRHGQLLSSDSSTADTTAAMSLSGWTRDTNEASSWLGGRYTPQASISWKKWRKRVVSHSLASSKLVTTPSTKNSVIIDPTRWTPAGTPACLMARSMPDSRADPRESSPSEGA